MVLLESEQFLTELTRLLQKCWLSGNVFITLKKYDGRTKPIPRKGSVEGFEPSDNKCLLRATDGKKKISTVVSSKEVSFRCCVISWVFFPTCCIILSSWFL
uniref:Signal recognition particle 14 kDa protein n=1 Tax=Balaenoptera musculus TaxID=9771 RepID=A0A8C0DTS1_BALMU